MFTRALIALTLLVAVAMPSAGAQTAPPVTSKNRKIMTWIPPYAVATSFDQLKQGYGGVGPANSITHLGLQFWLPTSDGGLRRDTCCAPITNQVIRQIVTWAHKYGIKVLLTVYNNDGTWNWPLASNAFGPNRNKFIKALLAEMKAQNLDGIDIDLEGYDDTNPNLNSYKTAYVDFIKGLSRQVHAVNGVLTADSLSYVWNAPNTDWWNDLFPYLDGLTSMGYEQLGRDPSDHDFPFRAYSWQVTTAGRNAGKLMIGVPSNFDSWEGNTSKEQLSWFLRGKVGISIWDAQNSAATWRSKPIWSILHKIHSQ